MPDPDNDIRGHHMHESKMRSPPTHIEVQPRQKDDGEHGEGDKEQGQHSVQLAQHRVALRRLKDHLNEVERVKDEGAEAKHKSSIAEESWCMGGLARVSKGLEAKPKQEVEEEEAGAEEEEEEQPAHLQSTYL